MCCLLQFERFFAHDTVAMATLFGPISFPPCPVLVFKEQHNGMIKVKLHNYGFNITK